METQSEKVQQLSHSLTEFQIRFAFFVLSGMAEETRDAAFLSRFLEAIEYAKREKKDK